METKICNCCKENKELNEFYKDKNKKDGLTTFCILCKKQSNKQSRVNNIEKRKETAKKYREENKELIKEKRKIFYTNNKDKFSDYNKKYREENKESIKERDKQYYNDNKHKIMNNYFKNREHNLKRMQNWKKENRAKLREYQNEYNSIRIKNDPLYRLKHNIRSLIRHSIKRNGFIKTKKTHEILGCSVELFKQHLESQFESWMTWDNYGMYNGTPNYGWDIDHSIPSSTAITEDDVIKLNHYTNLKPMCSYYNRDIKKDKVD
jgi:hypothetical protein